MRMRTLEDVSALGRCMDGEASNARIVVDRAARDTRAFHHRGTVKPKEAGDHAPASQRPVKTLHAQAGSLAGGAPSLKAACSHSGSPGRSSPILQACRPPDRKIWSNWAWNSRARWTSIACRD